MTKNKIQPYPTESDQIWQRLTQSDLIWPYLTNSNQIRPNLTESDGREGPLKRGLKPVNTPFNLNSCTSVGSEAKHATKNRYRDILPYDSKRVVLQDSSNMFHSDYINASYVTDTHPRTPAYIATQVG